MVPRLKVETKSPKNRIPLSIKPHTHTTLSVARAPSVMQILCLASALLSHTVTSRPVWSGTTHTYMYTLLYFLLNARSSPMSE